MQNIITAQRVSHGDCVAACVAGAHRQRKWERPAPDRIYEQRNRAGWYRFILLHNINIVNKGASRQSWIFQLHHDVHNFFF